MQLFILNRTNERQTKSVGRILLYALLFFIVTRIAVMLMLTGCTAIYMANTGINPMQGLSFFGNPSVAAAGMGWWAFIIRKSKCSTDFKRNDFLKKNEAYPLGALRSLKFAYRKLRISLFVELAV